MPTITPAQARRLLKKRKQQAKKAWDPHGVLFPHQRAIFDDPAPARAVIGTRQFGKTRLAATEIISRGLECPGSDVAYVDLDQTHGAKVMWREITNLLEENNVPAKLANDKLVFENGAVAYLFSGEPSEIKKLQGLKLSLLLIDESQDAPSLADILTMVSPALMRFNGRVLLLGIPGRVAGLGDWWDICEGKHSASYGQHRGTFRDNSALNQEAAERLCASEKERLGEESPEYLRHWRGVWPSLNNDLRVYRYFPDENGYDGEAPTRKLYALGLDPGGTLDEEAVIILGHGDTDGIVYHVDERVSRKREGGSWDDTADRVGPLDERYKCSTRHYDYGSAHKDSLSLIWQKDKHIVMTAVPSKDPYSESKRINELFQARRLFIRRGSVLERDMLNTHWEAKSLANGGKPKYDGGYHQNAADALRAAMWGVYGAMPRQPAKPLTDPEQELLAVKNLFVVKKTYRPTERQVNPYQGRRRT